MAAISTPDRSKRTIDDIISLSEVTNPGDHVHSPNPVRRKDFVTCPIKTSDPPFKHLDTDPPATVTDPITDPPQAPVADLSISDDIRCNEMADVIKAALSSPSVIKAISGAIIPSIVVTLDSKLAPLQQQLHNISHTDCLQTNDNYKFSAPAEYSLFARMPFSFNGLKRNKKRRKNGRFVKQIPSGNASKRLVTESNYPISSVSDISDINIESGESYHYVNHEHEYAVACVDDDLGVASSDFLERDESWRVGRRVVELGVLAEGLSACDACTVP